MATISVCVSGSSVGDVTITETLEGENSDRVMAYLLTTYGMDENGNARTLPQIIAAYWSGVRRELFERVRQHDQEHAAQAARDAVAAIESATEVS